MAISKKGLLKTFVSGEKISLRIAGEGDRTLIFDRVSGCTLYAKNKNGDSLEIDLDDILKITI